MHPELADHARYLEALRVGFRARPELHRHQLRVIERYLELARSAPSAGHYMAAADQLIELARSEWLDRYFGETYLAEALQDRLRRRAAVINFEAALAPTGHAALSASLVEGKARARPLELAAENAQRSLTSLLGSLLEWKTERDPTVRDNLRAECLGWWHSLREADPGCTLARVRTEPTYRHRVPFDDGALDVIEGWLRELVGEQAAPAAAPDDRDDLDRLGAASRAYLARIDALSLTDECTPLPAGSAADAAATYRLIRDSLPAGDPTRPVYAAIAALAEDARDANDFARAMIEACLHVELARASHLAQARAGITRARDRGQPLLARHFELVLEALSAARSITAVEQDLFYLELCLEVELAWTDVLLAYATRPLRAALGWEFDRSEEQRQSIIASVRAATEVFGLDWHGLVHAPQIETFIADVLVGATRRPDEHAGPSAGAQLGEVGLALAQDVRKTALLVEVARAESLVDELGVEAAITEARRSRFERADQLIAHATALFEQALGGGQAYVIPGDAARRTLRFWDRPRRIDQPAPDVAACRPPVRLP
ncbi:MAG TPA: hypothetical protein VML75_13680 [Kofleriaceae bacterium]|nr:hypothetical protein [Kofleriaceae bacterium]